MDILPVSFIFVVNMILKKIAEKAFNEIILSHDISYGLKGNENIPQYCY